MTLVEILQKVEPGLVFHHGNKNDADFVEIFVLQDRSIRFSEDLMEINSKTLSSDKWEF